MESSRIYIRNLPPDITVDVFKKHFSMGGFTLTDSKVIPQRRIGYIGFRSPEDATKAAKYFDKSFIKTSRIGVELARSVERQHQHVLEHKRERDRNGSQGDHGDQAAPVKRPRLGVNQEKRVGSGNQDQHVEGITGLSAVTKDEFSLPDSEQQESRIEFTAKDDDWLRLRTSRLLDLEDEKDEDSEATARRSEERRESGNVEVRVPHSTKASLPSDVGNAMAPEIITESLAPQTDDLCRTARLFLRNISYTATEDDIRAHFEAAVPGLIDEVHLSLDRKTHTNKGIAFIQCKNEETARKVMELSDGKPFQGRLLHVLPAEERRQQKLNDFAASKLPLKTQQQLKRKSEAGTSTFNWNSLYMNADAVMSSVSERLGVSKAELLDPTSSDAAVRQAHAETHVIQETKSYFLKNGVDLDAFKKKERGETAILVKNFTSDSKAEELKHLFEEFGLVSRFLMPPSGTIALVDFEQADNARAAYRSLAYRKVGGSILFLEKAPKDVFTGHDKRPHRESAPSSRAITHASAADLLARSAEELVVDTTTLFIGNISFSTTTDRLADSFRPLSGFVSAKVKMKADPKTPGGFLSMGIGFVEFKSKQQAQAGLIVMDGYKLDGHVLKVRASKSLNAADERRKEDRDKKRAGRATKIIIKNLPFEVSKKDVRSLFGTYGQLRSVRVPKKFDSASRGFAFADFITAKEAENAMSALANTHLLGRRLVLDFAAEDTADPEKEIEAMQQKAGHQAHRVAIQRLTGTGRKKFNVAEDHDPEAL